MKKDSELKVCAKCNDFHYQYYEVCRYIGFEWKQSEHYSFVKRVNYARDIWFDIDYDIMTKNEAIIL